MSYNKLYTQAPNIEHCAKLLDISPDNTVAIEFFQDGWNACLEHFKKVGNSNTKTGYHGIKGMKLEDLNAVYPQEFLDKYGHVRQRLVFDVSNNTHYAVKRYRIVNSLSAQGFLDLCLHELNKKSDLFGELK